ncbi:MAG: hypothetical protein ACOCP4_05300 [Candidatus Woesearchaeota archaeon]
MGIITYNNIARDVVVCESEMYNVFIVNINLDEESKKKLISYLEEKYGELIFV